MAKRQGWVITMSKLPGKDFEDNFAASPVKGDLQRFYDVMSRYKGQSYPADFYVFRSPHMFYLELKSTSTGTWPLQNMSDNQYNGLLEKDEWFGTVCGALIKYAKFDKHYFVPITEIKRFKDEGHASIRHKHIEDGKIKAIEMFGTKKRVNWTYETDRLLDDLEKDANLVC